MTDPSTEQQLKAWVVNRAIPYEGEQLVGVFTSEAHAEAYIASLKDQEGVYAEDWTMDEAESVEYEDVDGWRTPFYVSWTPAGVTRKQGKAAARSRRGYF